MNWSFSKLNQYILCPYKYKKIYMEGKGAETKHQFSFGKSVHNALEDFFKYKFLARLKLLKNDAARLLKLYKKNWISEGYESKEQENEYYQKGIRILNDYYEKNLKHNYFKCRFTERFFTMDVKGRRVNGLIDRIDEIEDGYEIIDYKTNESLPDEEELKNDLQLQIYYMAAKTFLNLNVARVSFHFLSFGKVYNFDTKNYFSIPQIEENVIAVIDQIAQEAEFPPKKNKYCSLGCKFAEECGVVFSC